MTYGKLNGEALVIATNTIRVNGRTIANPRAKDYKAAGYLPIDASGAPPEGYEWKDKWEISGEKIVKKYDPIPQEEQGEMNAMEVLSGEEAEAYREYQTDIVPVLEEVFG